jgi:SAM-dependent methyltransferase
MTAVAGETPRRQEIGGLTRTLRKVIPHRYRPLVRDIQRSLTWRIHAGDSFACPCCEKTFGHFVRYDQDLQCPHCGSLGRHRLTWLYVSRWTDLGERRGRLLHVAPERGLMRRFRAVPQLDYLTADLDSALADLRLDIADIPFANASVDAIICSHVLEHVEDDRKALHELFRVLRPGGWAILLAPVDAAIAVTIEDRTVTSAAERERLYGQYDHCRRYGLDYPERLSEPGFIVSADRCADLLDAEIGQRYGIDAGETVYVCRKPARLRGSRAAAALSE